MARLVVIDLHFGTFRVPAPPFNIHWMFMRLPGFGPFILPIIRTPSFHLRLPVIRVPVIRFPIPNPHAKWNWISLGWIPRIPIPWVRLPNLNVKRHRFKFLGGSVNFQVPMWVWLSGGHLGVQWRGPFHIGGLWVPTLKVSWNHHRFGGQRWNIPNIHLRSYSLNIPNIPRFNLPNFHIPTGVRLVGHVRVPAPWTFRVTWRVQWFVLRNWLFGWFPNGLIRNPREWIFNVVVQQFIAGIGRGLLHTLRDIVNMILSVALDRETKDEVANHARKDKPWES